VRRLLVGRFSYAEMIWYLKKNKFTESASNPLVDFGELNDNTIKGLTSLLSVEQEIMYIEYT
jgi:hypothetical protein